MRVRSPVALAYPVAFGQGELRFVEDNWELGRLGGGSLDELAGSFSGSFDFEHPHPAPLVLDSDTGELPRRPDLSIMREDQAHFVRAKYNRASPLEACASVCLPTVARN